MVQVLKALLIPKFLNPDQNAIGMKPHPTAVVHMMTTATLDECLKEC